jgi:hypothetical protein
VRARGAVDCIERSGARGGGAHGGGSWCEVRGEPPDSGMLEVRE